MKTNNKLNSFAEFYPFYLSEHQNKICRGLHYTGSLLVIALLLFALLTQQFVYLWLLPVIGYGFAWVGHFFIENALTPFFPLFLFGREGPIARVCGC